MLLMSGGKYMELLMIDKIFPCTGRQGLASRGRIFSTLPERAGERENFLKEGVEKGQE